MPETYVYIYRNDQLKRVYVGIGESPGRVWGEHNRAAQELLEHPETQVFITSDPFPDRLSAERAESAAICAAAAAGVAVIVADEEKEELERLTNIAKVSSSQHLSRAVFQKEGAVQYDSLVRTAIVVLHLDSIDDVGDGTRRPALHGGREEEVYHARATRWWGLGAADHRRRRARNQDGTLPRDVERLIAVQKGTSTILGAWMLSDEQWRPDGDSWMFVTDGVIDEWRGQHLDWCGASHSGGALLWSADIRAAL